MQFLIPILQRLLVWVVSKIFIALGLSFITYTGFTIGLDAIRDYVVGSFNNIPTDIFSLLMMAGFGEAIGIIFGAYSFNLAMTATTKLATGISNKL